MNNNSCYNPYEGGVVPPCSAYLGNHNPIIKDGKVIYKNENRLFFFISTLPGRDRNGPSPVEPETTTPVTEEPFTSSNLQVSLSTFIIGYYINQIQLDKIQYDQSCPIHSDKATDAFIHQTLQDPPQINTDYTTALSLIISNPNSVLPLYTYEVNITPLNYYILFIINRLENDPGLFFGNNSYATEDPINLLLAALNIQCPFIK